MIDVKKAKRSYRNHRKRALLKGLGFYFTYEEWVKWWEKHAGPDWQAKRGLCYHHLVMARHKDKGPYAEWNVSCITRAQNTHDQIVNKTSNYGSKNGTSKLTEAEVLEIYNSKDQVIDLAKKYKMSIGRISRIQHGFTWKHVTQRS